MGRIKRTSLKICLSFIAIFAILFSNISVAFAAELSTSTIANSTMSGSTQHSGKSAANTDGDTVNYTYTGKYVSSKISLYDYLSDKELDGQDRNSIASGYSDPYTRFNTAISNEGLVQTQVHPSSDMLTIRFKTKVKDLDNTKIYLFDDSGHSTGWGQTVMHYNAGNDEWVHNFVYDDLGFTPTKFIISGTTAYGQWQTDDISATMAKGTSVLYDDNKIANGTANQVNIKFRKDTARVVQLGGQNKIDQNLHIVQGSYIQANIYDYSGHSLAVNLSDDGTYWYANNIDVSAMDTFYHISLKSDRYVNSSNNYYPGLVEGIVYLAEKGKTYIFGDSVNLTTGSAYAVYNKTNRYKYPLYFGCFYMGGNASDYYADVAPDYASFAWQANMSMRNSIDSAVSGLVDNELTAAGKLQQDGKVLPYFDSTWVSGDVSRAGLMRSYEGLSFPFYEVNIDASTVKNTSGVAATGIAKYYQFNSKDVNVKLDNGQIVESSTAIHSQATVSGATQGFYPFDTVDDSSKLNLGFGAKFEIKFKLRSDGRVETVDNSGNGTGKFVDALFEFIGDDDVWVYVDNKLVLDLGGVHKDSTGVINFAERKSYANSSVAIAEETKNNLGATGSLVEKNLETILPDAFSGGIYREDITHTLTMFFMERGMYESDLLVRYNFAVIPNQNTYKIKEITDFSNVNPGFSTATEKAAGYDVFEYTLSNTSNEDGDASGLLTPVYDTYERTIDGHDLKLAGQAKGNNIYFCKEGADNYTNANRFVHAWVYKTGSSGKLYAPTATSADGKTFTFTVPADADRVIWLRTDRAYANESVSWPDGHVKNQTPGGDSAYYFTLGDVFQVNPLDYNSASVSSNVYNNSNNYVYDSSDPNHYVKNVNYLWTDAAVEKTGSDGRPLVGTTSDSGIFRLLYGKTTSESSAEFLKQFKKNSTMTITQSASARTPDISSSDIQTFNTAGRVLSDYYITSVKTVDSNNRQISTDTSFTYANSNLADVNDPVQLTTTFTNEVKTGSIEISKEILNEFANTSDTFEVQIQFRNIYGMSGNNTMDFTTLDISGASIDSTGHFTIHNGDTVIIDDIPVYTEYLITETSTGSEFEQHSITSSSWQTVSYDTADDFDIVNKRKVATVDFAKELNGNYNLAESAEEFILNISFATNGYINFNDYTAMSCSLPVSQVLSDTRTANSHSYRIKVTSSDAVSFTNVPVGSIYTISEEGVVNDIAASLFQSDWFGNLYGGAYKPRIWGFTGAGLSTGSSSMNFSFGNFTVNGVSYYNKTAGAYTGTVTGDIALKAENLHIDHGNLKIHKNVSSLSVSGYKDTSKQFSVTVTVPALSGVSSAAFNTIDNNSISSTITFNSGVAVVNLRDSEWIEILDLPDSTYTVAESSYSLYSSSNSTGLSGSITNHSTSDAYIVNDYINTNVDVKKIVDDTDNPDAANTGSFAFTVAFTGLDANRPLNMYKVKFSSSATYTTLGAIAGSNTGVSSLSINISLADDEDVMFYELPVGASILVSESLTAGQEYDTGYALTVNPGGTLQVVSGNTAAMSAAETMDAGDNLINIVFTNTYNGAGEFVPYVLPAAGMENKLPLVCVAVFVLFICVFGYAYTSRKIRNF